MTLPKISLNDAFKCIICSRPISTTDQYVFDRILKLEESSRSFASNIHIQARPICKKCFARLDRSYPDKRDKITSKPTVQDHKKEVAFSKKISYSSTWDDRPKMNNFERV